MSKPTMSPAESIGRIVALARLGEDVAAQASESLGHAVEKMQGEHLPEILARESTVAAPQAPVRRRQLSRCRQRSHHRKA